MTCNGNSSPSNNSLEDEKGRLMFRVAQRRKLFPKKCSQYLSKTLKMKHFILETTKIVLENTTEAVSEDSETCEGEDSDSEIEEALDVSVLTDKIIAVGKEADNIMAVFEQLKAEKDCDLVQTCIQGLQESSSNDSLT